MGVGEHPTPDPTEGLDRAATPNDAARRASVSPGALALAAVVAVLAAAGMTLRDRINEDREAAMASGLVQQLFKAETAEVPGIIRAIGGHRRRTDPELRRALVDPAAGPKEMLHASLALLPIDPAQVPYLEARLLRASARDLPVVRAALEPFRSRLVNPLWTTLESSEPGDERLLRAAAALALYEPRSPRWEGVSDRVARELVSQNSVAVGPWLEALEPVHNRLNAPLAAIFRDKSRSETVHSLATDILSVYAGDDPDLLTGLLLKADPPAYVKLFPAAERLAAQVVPMFQAELSRSAKASWNDMPDDPAWSRVDGRLVGRVESAHGVISDRFALCQTMPFDQFLSVADELRAAGYRPTRFRPYADGTTVRVAAVWTRDRRGWRIASRLSPEDLKLRDEQNRRDGYLPVDVAGYGATDGGGRPTVAFAALWAERAGVDDAAWISIGPAVDVPKSILDQRPRVRWWP